MYRILMIDDERSLLEFRSEYLREKGCVVDCAVNDEEALSRAKNAAYDCILLDVMLGNGCGFSLCGRLKELTAAPIIFLSSLTDDESQLEGFLSGGADYITKCAGLPLFWAKIQTRIRLSVMEKQMLTYAPLFIDLSARKVFIAQQEIVLTSLEFDILVFLAEKPCQTVSLAEIYCGVWGVSQWDQGQTVQVHMSRVRRKFEKAYPRHEFIETVWGKGYQFIPPD